VITAQLGDVAAANAELRKYHIHNVVVRPMTASCKNRNMTYTKWVSQSSPVTTLTPKTITPGYTVVLAAKQLTPTSGLEAFGRFRGRVPTCVSSHGWGPGMGESQPAKPKKKK
jgi:hypothetical protein